MNLQRTSLFTATLVFFSLFISSCSTDTPRSLTHVMPATGQATVTFNEKEIGEQCEVFAHLIISIPSGFSASQAKSSIEQFGASNGADLILIGMARESNQAPDTIEFNPYGPEYTYKFKQKWVGWKFGFSAWNSGGPLIDLDPARLSDGTYLFENPIDAQAVLLSCAQNTKTSSAQ